MAVPLIALGVLAFSQAMSGMQQANQIRAQGEIQKGIDDFNIQLSEYDAWQAERDGEYAMARYQTTIDQAEGTAKAVTAATGQSGFGSAADIQHDNQVTGFLNMVDIGNEAHRRANGFTREASNTRLQSGFNYAANQLKASATQNAGYMNAASTAISGYSNYSTKSDALLAKYMK